MTITEFLQTQVPFLSGLDAGTAHDMAAAVEQADFAAGKVILFQGVTVDQVHVIATGKVSITIKPKGREPVKVAELGPGQVFGEMSIVDTSVAGATVRAMEDTHIFLIHQDKFRDVLEKCPAVKERILAEIAARKASAQPKPAAPAS